MKQESDVCGNWLWGKNYVHKERAMVLVERRPRGGSKVSIMVEYRL